MKIPFVTFLPMERELNNDIRAAFDRVFTRSWYIEGIEDEAFENARSHIKNPKSQHWGTRKNKTHTIQTYPPLYKLIVNIYLKLKKVIRK